MRIPPPSSPRQRSAMSTKEWPEQLLVATSRLAERLRASRELRIKRPRPRTYPPRRCADGRRVGRAGAVVDHRTHPTLTGLRRRCTRPCRRTPALRHVLAGPEPKMDVADHIQHVAPASQRDPESHETPTAQPRPLRAARARSGARVMGSLPQ